MRRILIALALAAGCTTDKDIDARVHAALEARAQQVSAALSDGGATSSPGRPRLAAEIPPTTYYASGVSIGPAFQVECGAGCSKSGGRVTIPTAGAPLVLADNASDNDAPIFGVTNHAGTLSYYDCRKTTGCVTRSPTNAGTLICDDLTGCGATYGGARLYVDGNAHVTGVGSATVDSSANVNIATGNATDVKVGGSASIGANTYLDITNAQSSLFADNQVHINVGGGGVFDSTNFGADGAGFVGWAWKTAVTITTGLLVTWTNNGSVVASIDGAGHVVAGGGSANKAVCWKADAKTLGFCSTTPTNGSCTCN